VSFPIRYTALGLIARRPIHGYALVQQLQRWSLGPGGVRPSTVYTALSRLERDGLIEPSPSGDAPHGQPRIVYRATPDGEDLLDEWLAKPPTSFDELRARVAVGRPQDLERLIAYVTAEEQSCLERLHELETPPIAALASRNAPWDALCGAILGTLDTGELAGRVKWLQDARDALQAFRDHPDGAG
jgi:DNA-binding PadR family transcriptional regulator